MTGVAFAMTSVSGRLPCRMGVVSFASNVYQTPAGGLPFSTPHCLHTWRSFSDLKLKKTGEINSFSTSRIRYWRCYISGVCPYVQLINKQRLVTLRAKIIFKTLSFLIDIPEIKDFIFSFFLPPEVRFVCYIFWLLSFKIKFDLEEFCAYKKITSLGESGSLFFPRLGLHAGVHSLGVEKIKKKEKRIEVCFMNTCTDWHQLCTP